MEQKSHSCYNDKQSVKLNKQIMKNHAFDIALKASSFSSTVAAATVVFACLHSFFSFSRRRRCA